MKSRLEREEWNRFGPSMKQNSESVAGSWWTQQILTKCSRDESMMSQHPWGGGGLCTQSVQHGFKVHSVSIYFSAVRKIEKKGKTKNIHPAAEQFYALRVGQKSLGGTDVFTKITLKQWQRVHTAVKIKL